MYKCSGQEELPFKSSMETLLYLFCYYLDNEVSCRQNEQLRILKNYVGDESTLLCGSSTTNTTGIKVSTGNGFPTCLRESVIKNEGEDLSGFCHKDYMFSTFLDKFMGPTEHESGSAYDPLTLYGTPSIQTLRSNLVRQLHSNESVLSKPAGKEKQMKDKNAKISGKLANRVRDHFNPRKKRNMSMIEMSGLLNVLEAQANTCGKSIFVGVRLNNQVLEEVITDNTNIHPLVKEVQKEVESGASKKSRGKKSTAVTEAPKRTILGSSSCLNASTEAENLEKKKRQSNGASSKGQKRQKTNQHT